MEKVVDLIDEPIYLYLKRIRVWSEIRHHRRHFKLEILLVSQLFPSNPSGHSQEYVSSPVTVQVPPFWQGLSVHEFTVTKEMNNNFYVFFNVVIYVVFRIIVNNFVIETLKS